MKPGTGSHATLPMPELPEVEVVRRDLDAVWRDRTLTSVVVTGVRSVRRTPNPQHFVDRLTGARVRGTNRRGKHILVELDDGDVLVIHLRMSGQVLLAHGDDPAPKHTHVVFTTDAGDVVRFVDPRTFGELFVTSADLPELAHFGVEPLDPATTPAVLGAALRPRRVRLKALLLDQRVVAGIGNIYADEILFRAGLRWDRVANTLTDDEISRLHDAMRTVLIEAIDARGSSLRDAQYVDLFGRTGTFSAQHRVHARAGEPCPICGTPIERVRFAGRSTYFCPRCQG